jgi:Fe-Mn family superoxide dismutase
MFLRRYTASAASPAAACRGAVAMRYFTSLPTLTKPAGQAAALPPLDFDYAKGCPPVFSPRQVELHYTKHHKAYVDKLNALTAGNNQYDGQTIEAIAKSTEGVAGQQALFNQAAQHYNHAFFWKCITPNGSPMPAELSAAIAAKWGSVEAFQKAFQESAIGNFGSGWTWLVYDAADASLKIVNTGNAGTPVTKGLRPLFTADVWEHAYYKDFENRRADYVAEIWKVANWKFVGQEFARAKTA